MNAPIVAVGECMLELSSGASACRLGYAGDTLNTAVYLARLGLGVAYLTALGADPFSAEMVEVWREEGIDTSLVLTDPTRLPGLYAIRTDRLGERSFYYWRRHSAARRLLELPGIEAALASAGRARVLYLSGITLSLFDEGGRARLMALCREVRTGGGQVAFDPNYRPAGWADVDAAREAITAIAGQVSLAFPTLDDEVALYGTATPESVLERWRAAGVREVVVKLGAKGCLVASGEERCEVPARAHVMARDTTGAGDAFNAGYMAARWRGLGIVAAAQFANDLAGEVVAHPGAIIPYDLTPRLPVPAETCGDGA